jgi:toxic protein SymE
MKKVSSTATKPKIRRLKVHQKCFMRAYCRYVVYPEVRLCGKWLYSAGFVCGQGVTVKVEQGLIIIRSIQA